MTQANIPRLSIGQCATLACLLEVTAPKVGNVHRGADFPDLTFTDFAASAVAIAPAMENARQTGVGRAALDAITATRQVVSTNTNLGMVLLIAPLAAAPRDEPLTPQSIGRVLETLSAADSRLVYEAIRRARPGGMGEVEEMDIASEAPPALLEAMHLAARRDQIALEYVTDFAHVLERLLPALLAGRARGWSLIDTIVHTHLSSLAEFGDSLIARKCGLEACIQVVSMAAQACKAGTPGDEAYEAALADFDFWLRSDGNRRNPGATADLLAAALFAGLRDDLLPPPWT